MSYIPYHSSCYLIPKRSVFKMFRMLRNFQKINFVNSSSKQIATVPVGVIGAPFCRGQPKHGVELGPSALRQFGLLDELKNLGIDIEDYGDIEVDDFKEDPNARIKFPLSVGSACQKLSEAVKNILEERGRCLTLGGDHSLGIGSVHGHSLVYKDLCLLWVDAHADINTETTSLSGNMHGMSCSFLIKELEKYKKQRNEFKWCKPCINKQNIAYIGLRDVDPLEKLILTKEGILHFTMKDIDRLGILEVTNRALDAINPNGKLSLHVSFDIDSIDNNITPSTGTPVPGGLTIREALCIAEEICSSGTLRAVDLVEVNPELGTKEQIHNTLAVAVLVIKTLFGYTRSGYLSKDLNVIPVD